MNEKNRLTGNDIIFENLTDEERKKLQNLRAEAQYFYEKVTVEMQKAEQEKEKQLQQFLLPVTQGINYSVEQVLKKASLIPPDKKLSLKTQATVLSAFARELGNYSTEDNSEEFTDVCRKLAHAHKAISATDAKGGPKTDNDWNVMIDNLNGLSHACADYINSEEDDPDSDKKTEDINALGTFAFNRRESLINEMEHENAVFMNRMTKLKENINDFVLLKYKLAESGLDGSEKNEAVLKSAEPEFFGNSLRKAVKLNKFFKEEKNEDMIKRTGELISEIGTFLENSPEIKADCGVSREELKSFLADIKSDSPLQPSV